MGWKNCVMCNKKGVPQKYLPYGRNIGKLYITVNVIGQTLARIYVGRISTSTVASLAAKI